MLYARIKSYQKMEQMSLAQGDRKAAFASHCAAGDLIWRDRVRTVARHCAGKMLAVFRQTGRGSAPSDRSWYLAVTRDIHVPGRWRVTHFLGPQVWGHEEGLTPLQTVDAVLRVHGDCTPITPDEFAAETRGAAIGRASG